MVNINRRINCTRFNTFAAGVSEVVSGSDNRGIMDDGASQELTEENIAEMKGQGASGKVGP